MDILFNYKANWSIKDALNTTICNGRGIRMNMGIGMMMGTGMGMGTNCKGNNSLAMSNKGRYTWLANSLILHSRKPFYFCVALIQPIIFKSKQFEVAFSTCPISIITLRLLIFFHLPPNFTLALSFIIFFDFFNVHNLSISLPVLVFSFIFVIRLTSWVSLFPRPLFDGFNELSLLVVFYVRNLDQWFFSLIQFFLFQVRDIFMNTCQIHEALTVGSPLIS